MSAKIIGTDRLTYDGVAAGYGLRDALSLGQSAAGLLRPLKLTLGCR